MITLCGRMSWPTRRGFVMLKEAGDAAMFPKYIAVAEAAWSHAADLPPR